MDTTTQIYLEVTPSPGKPVLGETKAGGYENRIDIDTFSFSVKGKKQTLKDVEQLQNKTNLDYDTISVSKVFDRASLQLAGLMMRPQAERQFHEVKLAVDEQYITDAIVDQKIRNEILIIHLYGCYISNFQLQTSEGGTGAQVKETIDFSFHKIKIIYYAENRDRSKSGGDLGDQYRTEYHDFESSWKEQEA